MHEAEKRKTLRMLPCTMQRASEWNHSRLPRVQSQAVLRKALAQYRHHSLRVVFALEYHDRIVRVADEVRFTAHARVHVLEEPPVQYLMQKDVCEDWGNDTP